MAQAAFALRSHQHSAGTQKRNVAGGRFRIEQAVLQLCDLALPRDDSAFRLLVDKTLARLYRTRIKAILAKTFGNAPLDGMFNAMFVINSLPER